MAWGTEDNETKSNLTTTEVFGGNQALNPGEIAHVEVDADFIVSPTDNIIVRVYGSIDGTNYDDTPMMEFTIDKDTDPNQVSFIIHGVKSFRVGLLMDGSTDTTSDATINVIMDGVNL